MNLHFLSEEVKDNLKNLGAGMSILTGFFMFVYFFPMFGLFAFTLCFFLGASWFIGFMIRDAWNS